MKNMVDRVYEILKLNRSRDFERSSNSIEEDETGRKRKDVDIIGEKMVSDRSFGEKKVITNPIDVGNHAQCVKLNSLKLK